MRNGVPTSTTDVIVKADGNDDQGKNIITEGERERQRETERVLRERATRTKLALCVTSYAALQTLTDYIYHVYVLLCIGMATHLDRESTCTVIETNMVILFGAYLAYFSLTNQSREVTCDFGFASGDDVGWSSGDRDRLENPRGCDH